MDARELMAAREALVRAGTVPPVPLNRKNPRYSASTVKLHKRCPRKHAIEQVCGIEPPVTAALTDGTRLHGIVERWLKKTPRADEKLSTMWSVAATGLQHLPDPDELPLLVEVPRKMSTWPGGPEFTGTPDLMRVRPVGGGFVEVDLYDHKTTSGYARGAKNGWVLTSETLPDDVQNIAYSTFAFKQLDATAVNSKWIYYEKKGGEATAVQARMEKVETLKKWRNDILPIIGEMHEQHTSRPVSIADVEPRGLENGECDSYGGCPHRSYCHKFISKSTSVVDAPKGEERMSENPLLARLAAKAAGDAPKAPEAAPLAQAVVEQPKALAINPPPPPKVELPAQAAVEAPQAAAVEAPQAQVAAEPKRGPGRPKKASAEPDVGAVMQSQAEDHAKLQSAMLKTAPHVVGPSQVAALQVVGFNYYVGCKPTRGSTREEVNVVDLLKPYCDNISKVNGRYWQCVEYGQGPKQVAGLLESALESGALSLAGKNVVSPLVGPEAEICRSVLQPRAQAVVERFA